MDTGLLIDIIGWAGAVSVLSAYFLVSVGKVKGDSLKYQSLNIFGALCLAVLTYFKAAYPSALVNVIWILIALYSLHKASALRKISSNP